jgi:hypothetical protein
MNGVSIAAAIARSVAAVGLSAVFFRTCLIDYLRREIPADFGRAPRIGKSHVIYCLDCISSEPSGVRRDHGDVAATIVSSP